MTARIAIDGLPGSGKTTVCNGLRPLLEDLGPWVVVPEASRLVSHLVQVRSADDWEALLLDQQRLEMFFKLERVVHDTADSLSVPYVVDSGRLLSAAYAAAVGIDQSLLGFDVPYDKIFWCDAPSVAEDDGYRTTSLNDVFMLEYERMSSAAGLEVHRLPWAADRVGIVMNAVESLS